MFVLNVAEALLKIQMSVCLKMLENRSLGLKNLIIILAMQLPQLYGDGTSQPITPDGLPINLMRSLMIASSFTEIVCIPGQIQKVFCQV